MRLVVVSENETRRWRAERLVGVYEDMVGWRESTKHLAYMVDAA